MTYPSEREHFAQDPELQPLVTAVAAEQVTNKSSGLGKYVAITVLMSILFVAGIFYVQSNGLPRESKVQQILLFNFPTQYPTAEPTLMSNCYNAALNHDDGGCPLSVGKVVCGCDGNSYMDACVAAHNGILKHTEGACPSYTNSPSSSPVKLTAAVATVDTTSTSTVSEQQESKGEKERVIKSSKSEDKEGKNGKVHKKSKK